MEGVACSIHLNLNSKAAAPLDPAAGKLRAPASPHAASPARRRRCGSGAGGGRAGGLPIGVGAVAACAGKPKPKLTVLHASLKWQQQQKSEAKAERRPVQSISIPKHRIVPQLQGASGRSSGSALLSTAACSSMICGLAAVPAFHFALRTVKAE